MITRIGSGSTCEHQHLHVGEDQLNLAHPTLLVSVAVNAHVTHGARVSTDTCRCYMYYYYRCYEYMYYLYTYTNYMC